jgi:hypothetical protein
MRSEKVCIVVQQPFYFHEYGFPDLEQSSLATQSDLSGAGHKAPLVFTVPLKEDNPFRVQVLLFVRYIQDTN